jgi:hypothetical protein
VETPLSAAQITCGFSATGFFLQTKLFTPKEKPKKEVDSNECLFQAHEKNDSFATSAGLYFKTMQTSVRRDRFVEDLYEVFVHWFNPPGPMQGRWHLAGRDRPAGLSVYKTKRTRTLAADLLYKDREGAAWSNMFGDR